MTQHGHDTVQMLMLRSDWQAALPKLTQLGNGQALLTCLDSMLSSHADRAFLQLAPLLGITSGIGGHMQCLVSRYMVATDCTDGSNASARRALVAVWAAAMRFCFFLCAGIEHLQKVRVISGTEHVRD